MKTPDISIIIPAYNVEQYIAQCLDSIMCQDGAPDFEIIIVNDGSTDNTAQIVQDYRYNHSNIKLITQKNRGVSVARNNALANATGRFISFVDADDMVGASYKQMLHYFTDAEPQVLRLNSDRSCDNMQITFMYFHTEFDISTIVPVFDANYFANLLMPLRSNDVDISFGGKITIDTNSRGLLRNVYTCDKVYGTNPTDKQIILHHADIRESANFALFRRKFMERANLRFLSGMHLDEDMVFTQQAVLRARNVATVRDATYLYNRHAGTLSQLVPTFMGINPKYELAKIQRHCLILSELAEIPRYKGVYKHFLQKYSHDENKASLNMYPDAILPGRCASCDMTTCVKCPMRESVQSLIQANIDKYVPKQR